MYCVKCGVKLQDGVSACPLCRTPVWNPEQPEAEAETETGFPEVYPDMHRESNLPAAVALTVLCVTAAAVIFAVCMKLYGKLNWGGYAIGGLTLFYVIAVLPNWFREAPAEIFLPADHAAAAPSATPKARRTGRRGESSFASVDMSVRILPESLKPR